MKKEILFVLLNGFADWEGAYIAPSLSCGVEPGSKSKYVVKTVSLTKDPAVSCGGFKVLPDYEIGDIPVDYAGVVLVGGMGWLTPEAEAVVALVKDAIANNKLVAGICNASVFLGMHGFLNRVNHTSNGLDYLKNYAGANYTGESRYKNEPAVRDANIVTANGFSALEFCREILYALEADTPKKIEKSYRMNKTGVWEASEAE
ncbi:MAG: glutamine amidotransferase [Bacteroidales bacterium]|nr:glutamine amidotransferase [Bacteroidales bacterium]